MPLRPARTKPALWQGTRTASITGTAQPVAARPRRTSWSRRRSGRCSTALSNGGRARRTIGLPRQASPPISSPICQPKHRDTRGGGCPMAALASDLPRLAAPSRIAFAAGVRGLTDTIAAQLERLGHEKPAMMAGSVIAELFGSLSLARCEPDRERSDAILVAARQSLLRRLGLRRVS